MWTDIVTHKLHQHSRIAVGAVSPSWPGEPNGLSNSHFLDALDRRERHSLLFVSLLLNAQQNDDRHSIAIVVSPQTPQSQSGASPSDSSSQQTKPPSEEHPAPTPPSPGNSGQKIPRPKLQQKKASARRLKNSLRSRSARESQASWRRLTPRATGIRFRCLRDRSLSSFSRAQAIHGLSS